MKQPTVLIAFLVIALAILAVNALPGAQRRGRGERGRHPDQGGFRGGPANADTENEVDRRHRGRHRCHRRHPMPCAVKNETSGEEIYSFPGACADYMECKAKPRTETDVNETRSHHLQFSFCRPKECVDNSTCPDGTMCVTSKRDDSRKICSARPFLRAALCSAVRECVDGVPTLPGFMFSDEDEEGDESGEDAGNSTGDGGRPGRGFPRRNNSNRSRGPSDEDEEGDESGEDAGNSNGDGGRPGRDPPRRNNRGRRPRV